MKIFKRLMILTLIIASALAPLSAFAVDEGKIVTEVSMLNATLYLSDWNEGEIILKDISPVLSGDSAAASAAAALEYTAVPAFDDNMVYAKDGSVLDAKSLAWFLDMKVRATVVKLTDGTYRVIGILVK